jgi:hypothetical protein
MVFFYKFCHSFQAHREIFIQLLDLRNNSFVASLSCLVDLWPAYDFLNCAGFELRLARPPGSYTLYAGAKILTTFVTASAFSPTLNFVLLRLTLDLAK